MVIRSSVDNVLITVNGTNGQPGAPGTSSYIHIKYSNDGGATFTANDGETIGAYIGIYKDSTEADSKKVSDYQWKKIEGEDGEPAYTIMLSNENFSISTDTSYVPIHTQNFTCNVTVLKGSSPADFSITASTDTENDIVTTINGHTVSISVAPVEALTKTQGVITLTIATADHHTFTKDITWSVAVQGRDGQSGSAGVSIDNVVNYYLITIDDSPVTKEDSGWSTTIQSMTEYYPYLWTYEDIIGSDGSTISSTEPMIIGRYGRDGEAAAEGRGILSITEHYQTSSSNTIAPETWSDTPVATDNTNKYLWNYETIIYTDNTSEDTQKRVIGTHGTPGANGTSVTVSSTSIKYAISASGTQAPTNESEWGDIKATTEDKPYLWTRTIVTYSDNNKTTSYSVSRQGIDGINGQDGKPGKDGKDGTSTYVHIKYSDVANPTDADLTETPSDYIGICHDSNLADPTTASSYTWSKWQGHDGKNGQPGAKGEDGTNSYIHFAYSTSSDGSQDFSPSSFDGALYIGILVDDILEDSTDYTDYEWSLIKGEDGTSVEITSTSVQYAISADGVNTPAQSEWKNAIPATTTEKQYLWTKTVVNYSDNTSTTSYSVARQGIDGINGKDGQPGTNGKDGTSTYVHIKYSAVANPTDSDMTETPSDYIGICHDSNVNDPTTASSYAWSKWLGEDGKDGTPGKDGTNGKSSYTHFAYANSADGSEDFSTSSFAGAKYIGIRVDEVKTDSTRYQDYTWNLIKGEDGNDGVSITSVVNYYLATSASSGVTKNTTGWTTTIQSIDETNQYLWNYEEVKGSNNTTISSTTPVIIGRYGKDGEPAEAGRGITGIVEHYQVSSSNTTAPTTWSNNPVATDITNKYLWNYETIYYTDDTSEDTKKRVIGTHGTPGTSVTVTSTEYKEGTSPTTVPTGSWSTTPVAVSEGNYLWTRVTYSDGKTSYSVAKQGVRGTSVTVTKTEYAYKLSTSGTVIPTGTWETTPQAPTTTQYAWTRTTTTFSDGSTAVTYTVGGKVGEKGSTGDNGRGIVSITEYFLLSDTDDASKITFPEVSDKHGWTTVGEALIWSKNKPYLWHCTEVVYENPSSTVYIDKYCDTSWKAADLVQSNLTDFQQGVDQIVDRDNQSIRSAVWENTYTYKPKKDAQGNYIYDEHGKIVPDTDNTTNMAQYMAETIYDMDGITSRVSSSESSIDSLGSRVSTAESTITQHATDIEAKVSKDGVIAAINLSTETEGGSTAKISADKVEINGTAIFNSIKDKTDEAYDTKGAASQAESNAKSAIPTKVSQLTNDSKFQTDTDVSETVEQINKETISRGEQLVTNGNGMTGDNTNFSKWIFDGSQSNGSPGSFTRIQKTYSNIASDEYFPVDPSKRYRFEFDLKSENNIATMYAMLIFFDVDKKSITASCTMWYPDTLTTLTQDLKDGDTVIHLANVSHYKTYGTGSHQRALTFWNYTNSFGYQYPSETYSRNSIFSAWTDDNSIDKQNNTISLASAYKGVTIPAGTYVSQGNSGATYKYSGIANKKVPAEWTHYVGYFDGTDYSGKNVTGMFPPGTAYCKVGFLWNNNSADDQIWVTNIAVYEDYKTDIQNALTTANAAAPKIDAINRQQRIYYRKTTSGAPSKNTTWLTTSGTGYDNWSLSIPPLTNGDTKYPYLYTAVQTQTVAQQAAGDACTCSDVLIDDTTTVIDGGNIITGTVTAREITADNLQGDHGWINLKDGKFYYGDKTTFDSASNAISWNGSKLQIKADEFLLASGKSIFDEVEAIETWFYATAPTTSNEPAKNWTTDNLKKMHLRDIYFDTNSGKSYRWAIDGTTYKWVEIEDKELSALAGRVATAETNISTNSEQIALRATKTEIANTYATKDSVPTSVTDLSDADNYATKDYADDAAGTAETNAKNDTTNKLKSYYTKTETDSAISQTAEGITTKVTKLETRSVGNYATSSTGAGTTAKVATIVPAVTGWELYNGAVMTVKFTAANTASAPTLNVNSTGAKPIKTYSGGNLSETEYKWDAGTTMSFVYDGTNWRIQDSSELTRLKNAETSISQNAEAISLRATKTEAQGYATTAENNAKDDTTNKLKSYSTTTEMNAAIELSASGITSTVSKNYTSKSDFNDYKTTNDSAVAEAKKAGDDAQASIDEYKGTVEETYATKSALTQTESSIKQEVSSTYTTQTTFGNYKTSNDEAVAAAKKAGDDAQSDLNSYKTTNDSAVNAVKSTAESAKSTAEATQTAFNEYIAPVAEKTYTDVYASAANDTAGRLYFGYVRPESFNQPWSVTYHISATIKGLTNYQTGEFDVTIMGARTGYYYYDIYNCHTSSDYRSLYSHLLYSLKEAGFNNGYRHLLGIRLYSSYDYAKSEHSRTFHITVTEAKNCEIEMADSMFLYSEAPGTGSTNYNTCSVFDGTTNGHTVTGDRNTTNQLYVAPVTVGAHSVFPYSLIMRDSDNTWSSFINAYTGTGTNKEVYTGGFLLGKVMYSAGSSTYTTGKITSTIYDAISVDARYSFNCGQTLIPNKALYLVGSIHDDGKYYVDETEWYTQEPPTEADGKTYIYLGTTYNKYSFYLSIDNPAYEFYDGEFRELTDVKISRSSKATLDILDDEITSKVNASETRTKEYTDGKMSQEVIDRNSAISQKATEITTSVSSTYATKDSLKTTSDNLADYISSNNSVLKTMQDQIDGAIETWFYTVDPTTSNEPAKNWNTTDLKNIHLGDLYYNTTTGHVFRWQLTENTYFWTEIEDTDARKALADAAKAQTTANSKRRVFVAQPTTPYDIGDLWVQGKSGDIMRCSTARASGSYTESDWVKASKYTDDSSLDSFKTTYNTKMEQTDSAIALRATKTEAQGYANTAETNAKADTTEKLKSYSTTTEMNSAIETKANEITSSVSTTYATKTSVPTKTSQLTNDSDFATESYADGKASDAETAAKGYADTQIGTAKTEIKQTTDNISSRVTKTEAKISGHYATSSTAAGTAAKAATITPTTSNWELYTGASVTVKFTNANTNASPTLNVNSKGAKAIKSYTGANLSEAEYKWVAGATITFVYNGSNWLMQDGGTTARISSAETTIQQTANNVLIKATQNDTTVAQGGQHIIDSLINVAPKGIKISADKVNIEGAAIFSSGGRLSEASLDAAYDTKGAASAVQTNLDNLEIGGRNLLIDTNAPSLTKIAAKSDRYWSNGGNLAEDGTAEFFEVTDAPVAGITYGVRLSATVERTEERLHGLTFYQQSTSRLTFETGQAYTMSCYIRLASGDANRFSLGLESGSSWTDVSHKYFTPTSNWQRISRTFIPETQGANKAVYFQMCYLNIGVIEICGFKMEKGNKATDWTPAPEDTDAAINTVQENLDNMEIGGRNLLRNTKDFAESTYSSTCTFEKDSEGITVITFPAYTGSVGWKGVTLHPNIPYTLIRNKTVTLSFWYRSDSWTLASGGHNIPLPSFEILANATDNPSGTQRLKYQTIYDSTVSAPTTEWQRFVRSYNITDSFFTAGSGTVTEDRYFTIQMFQHNLSQLQYKKIQLEIGNKPTDWTPAPEDVQDNIDNIRLTGKNLLTGTNTVTAITSTGTHDNRTWRKGGDGTGTITHIDVEDAPYNVIKNGWKFDVTSVKTTNYGSGLLVAQNAANVVAGKTYTMSCYAKGTGTLYMFCGITSYVPSDGSGKITVTSSWQKYSVTFTAPSNTAVVNANGTNVFFGASGTNISLSICGMMLEEGDTATLWSPAPEDITYEEQRIYYRSKVSTKPNGNALPTAWVTNTANKWNSAATNADGWSRKITPISNGKGEGVDKFLYLFTCTQSRSVSGNVTYSEILLDDSTTVIDGGNIITGTVTANQIAANAVTAEKIQGNSLSIGVFDTATQNSVLNSNLKVGGRNLIVNTNIIDLSSDATLPRIISQSVDTRHSGTITAAEHGIRTTVGSASRPAIRFGSNSADEATMNGLKAGGTYTISFDCAWRMISGLSSGTTSAMRVWIQDDRTTTGTLASSIVTTFGTATAGQEGSARCEGVFTIPDNVTMCNLYISAGNSSASAYAAGDYIELANIKLEEGNMASSWTAAPEDIDNDFNSSLNEINETISGIQIGGRNLIQNTNKVSLATQSVRPNINGHYNDGSHDHGNVVGVTNAPLAVAEHGVIATATSAECPRVQFGVSTNGTTDIERSRGCYGLIPGKTYTWSYDLRCDLFGAKKATSTTYVRSILYYGTEDAPSFVTNDDLWINAITYLSTEQGTEKFAHIEHTFTIPEDAIRIVLICRGSTTTTSYYATGDFLEMTNIKLEEGNRATAWTPAPEDFDSDIADVNSRVNETNEAISGLEQTVTGWLTFENAKLTIGQKEKNNIFRTEITGTEMSFWEDTTKVAYISNKELNITNATVKENLTIGKFIFRPHESKDGGMSLIWS